MLVLELFVVLVIVVGRLAREKVDPPAAVDRIALQDRRELLGGQSERASLGCPSSASASSEWPSHLRRRTHGQRIVGFREQSIARQLQHGVQRTAVDSRAERRDVLLRDRGPQLSQRIARPTP